MNHPVRRTWGGSRWIATRIVAIAAASFSLTACVSTVVVPPQWAVQSPTGYAYNYLVGTGTGPEVTPARSAAVENAYQVLISTAPRMYQSATFRQQFLSIADEVRGERGSAGSTSRQRMQTDGTVDGTMLAQAFPRLEMVKTEYRSCDRCDGVTAFVLFRYLKPVSQRREAPNATNFFARSMVLPGWGQITKGESRKGWSILVLSAAGATTALVGRQRYGLYLDSALTAPSQIDRDRVLTRMGSAREFYYGGLAVAAGSYGYGLIDAVTGPARFYAFLPGRQRGLGVGAEFRF